MRSWGDGPRWSPLTQLGRTSLFIYWIHVELVYGLISRPWHRALTLFQAFIAYVIVCGLMLACSIAKERIAQPLRAGSGAGSPGARQRSVRLRCRHAHGRPQNDVVGRSCPPAGEAVRRRRTRLRCRCRRLSGNDTTALRSRAAPAAAPLLARFGRCGWHRARPPGDATPPRAVRRPCCRPAPGALHSRSSRTPRTWTRRTTAAPT